MSGQQQIKELLSGFASRLSLLLKSQDDSDCDPTNPAAINERILTNERQPVAAASLIPTLTQLVKLTEEAKHKLSCPKEKENEGTSVQLHSQRVRFLPSFKSPLHGISESVTVLSSSSNKDGQGMCWDAGVGMVADRLTNRASYSPSTRSVWDSAHTTTVLVSKRSETKMQLRSQAVGSTNKFHRSYMSWSSSSSSQSSSGSEDNDPIFQVSEESTDTETKSVLRSEITSVSLPADCSDLTEKSLSTSNIQTDVFFPPLTPENAVKNGHSSPSSQSHTIPKPLLSRIRPCHVVLPKINPLLLAVERPPLPWRPRQKEQTVLERPVATSVIVKKVDLLRKGHLEMDKQHTLPENSDQGSANRSSAKSQMDCAGKDLDENHQMLLQTPASIEDQVLSTPPSCNSVHGNDELDKKKSYPKRAVKSSYRSPRRNHSRVRNGSFSGHRLFQASRKKNHLVEDEPDKAVVVREDPLEQWKGRCTKEQPIQHVQQSSAIEVCDSDPSDVNNSLPIPDDKGLNLGNPVKPTTDSEVDIMSVEEDSARVHCSRRKMSHPQRVDVNLKMRLSQEEVLSPYEFESEQEDFGKDGSPSLLDHTDHILPGMQESVDHAQFSSELETAGEKSAPVTTSEDESEQPSTSTMDPAVPSIVRCTSCSCEISWETEAICLNPRLRVLVCKTCWRNFRRGDFYIDEDGKETYCSLCGEGGSVVCCDSCEKTFCITCISRISGLPFMKSLLDSSSEEEWLCYSCNPTPLVPYQKLADSLLQLLSTRKNQREKAPKKKMQVSVLKSKETVSTSSSEESEREVGVIHESHIKKTTTPIKNGNITTLSPKSNPSKTPVKRFHKKMDQDKSNSVTSAERQSRKLSVLSSSSDDDTRFFQRKRKQLSASATPQPIVTMSDDSDFDLSSTPMVVKKPMNSLSGGRKKRIMSALVHSEDKQQRKFQHSYKKRKSNSFVHSSDSSRTSHTLVSLDDTPKPTSSDSSDSGEEVKSEEVSLSDDDVFEPVDLRTRQKHNAPRKQAIEQTNDTSKAKNSDKKRPSLSHRKNCFGRSEYRPSSFGRRSESDSSVRSIDKATSDSDSSMVASCSRRSCKRRLSMLDSNSSVEILDKRLSEKKKRCLADDLSSGSETGIPIEKPSHRSLENCLSSENESEANTKTSKHMFGSASLPSKVNGVFPLDTQDVEYQVMGVVSSGTDSMKDQSENDQPRRKVRRKLIISSDSDHSNYVSRKSSASTRDSTDDDDFEEVHQRFRGSHGYHYSWNSKRRTRKGIIVTSSDEEDGSEDSEKTNGAKKSSESDEKSSQGKDKDVQGKRRNIRKLMPEKKLADQTKLAQRAERERIERLKKRTKSFSEQDGEIAERIILDKDPKTNKVRLEVRPKLVPKILSHQRLGIQFLFNSCCEDLDRMKVEEGSGAILAHCMGLGKTLQVIAFVDAFLSTNIDFISNFKVLVLCPVNTLLNWHAEFERWIPLHNRCYNVWAINDQGSEKRFTKLERWYGFGGVALMGYDMFRNLAMGSRVHQKRKREAYKKFLLDPGADFIVCDEGHVLRHETTNLSQIINQVRTKRRIVLSGTPLQNSLKEYYTMVNFVKPNLLGTLKEFHNRFINPITNGQCRDSRPEDVRLMKQRAHVLYELMQGCVDRRDYRILAESLPPKLEFVISVRMCPLQADLINRYLDNTSGMHTATNLFSTFANLMKVWNHPWVLKLDEQRKEREELRWMLNEKDSDSFIVDDSEISEEDETTSTTSTSVTKDCSRSSSTASDVIRETSPVATNHSPTEPTEGEQVKKSWFSDILPNSCELDVSLSGKLLFLRELLNETEKVGEKILLFSQSILLLDFIEELIQKPETGFGEMIEGVHYYRLDGSTKQGDRADFMSEFNKTNNRIRLFLISTKAGSLGVNLIGANRVIIFDTCWNPSHDLQSIFRTYRFGQTKPVFVYRLLAQGTMEEKIYDRQVTKQSLSMRVVDQMQIGRHYTFSELQELFTFTPASPPPENPSSENPGPSNDKPQEDFILSNILDRLQPKWVINYHKHDSLLEHIYDEELSEEERKLAWDNYNASKKVESQVYNVGLQAGTTTAASDASLLHTLAPPLVVHNRPYLPASQPLPPQRPGPLHQMPFNPHHIHWQRMQTQKRITANIIQLFNIGFATCNEANALIAHKNSLVPFLHNPLQMQNYEAARANLNRKLLLVNSTNTQISSILQSSAIAEVLSDMNRRQLDSLHKQYSAKLHELEQNHNASNILSFSHGASQ